MRWKLNTVGSAAVAVWLAASTLAAQTDKAKCSYTDDVTGKVVIVLCLDAPAGAKPVKQAPATTTPAAQVFPFPGETPGSNAPQNPVVPQNPTGQPATPAATDSSAPASKRFPFPGEAPATQAVPAPAPSPNSLHDAGSQGDSTKPLPGESSSSSSSSASNPDSADPNDPPDAAPIPHQSRHPVPAMKEKTPEESEAEDISVASFYMDTKNFQGAYMRGKDAVSLDDTDPAAHLALAEAARRLGKLDEAQVHYRRCLELDPVPKDKKIAEQALKEMAGKH